MKLYPWLGFSIVLHAALARVPVAPPRATGRPPPAVVEIEMTRDPAPPEALRPAPAPSPSPSPSRSPTARPVHGGSSVPAPPRPAGTLRATRTAVLAAEPTGSDDDEAGSSQAAASGSEEPVRFAPSPAFAVGPVGKAASPPPRAAASVDVSRPARLEEGDPCRGYFPAAARADSGYALVDVTVGAAGAVTTAAVLSETPPDEGFGRAARACLLGKRFTPALDRAGRPTTSAATVRIRFSR